MNVRIIASVDGAVLYCSTSMWAFGMVMTDREEAESFLQWLPLDAREYSDRDLEVKYRQFMNETNRLNV